MPMEQVEFMSVGPAGSIRVHVPYSGSSNSRAAALSIASRSGRDEAMLYEYIRLNGAHGATDEEIREHFDWSGDYARPRRWALSRKGRVIARGKRRNNKDNLMTVWVVPAADV